MVSLQKIRKVFIYSLVSVVGFVVGFAVFHRGNNFLLDTVTVVSADTPAPPGSGGGGDGDGGEP